MVEKRMCIKNVFIQSENRVGVIFISTCRYCMSICIYSLAKHHLVISGESEHDCNKSEGINIVMIKTR